MFTSQIFACDVANATLGYVLFHVTLEVLVQLCPTQMAYWAKNHVAILTRVAHLITY